MMRSGLFLTGWLMAHAHVTACTAFKCTSDGHTFIGCNEDARSINAQVRFVQGRNADYGAIYFDHFNGHPLRQQGAQLGMNEAGLVFDGLSIQPHQVAPVPGLQQVRFDDLMPMLMRTCATVHEAATRMRAYDFSWLTRSMLFFADRNGDYLIVENDTMIMGHDATYAVGNWRIGSCSDPAAIPIPRLQRGRQLLLSGGGATLEGAKDVLSTMSACRPKMGEGTLFSVLFDPQEAQAHLYFYHDFNERVTFDLKEELAKGDRTVDMASLFGVRPEYEKLRSYITPFHRRGLFRVMLVWLALAMLAGAASLAQLCSRLILRLRQRMAGPLHVPALGALLGVLVASLLGVLLMLEGPYYFGLGDAHPALVWAPALIVGLGGAWWWGSMKSGASRLTWAAGAMLLVPLLTAFSYWDMLLPSW